MQCPYCSSEETKVLDKRDAANLTRRRRECLDCRKRFSTKEAVEWADLRVIKKSGEKQSFDRAKIKLGIVKACEKRPVSDEEIERMITKIEEKARKKGKEIKTMALGEMVSNELKKVDSVAYIRFASVYREFAELSDFKKEIRGLLQR